MVAAAGTHKPRSFLRADLQHNGNNECQSLCLETHSPTEGSELRYSFVIDIQVEAELRFVEPNSIVSRFSNSKVAPYLIDPRQRGLNFIMINETRLKTSQRLPLDNFEPLDTHSQLRATSSAGH